MSFFVENTLKEKKVCFLVERPLTLSQFVDLVKIKRLHEFENINKAEKFKLICLYNDFLKQEPTKGLIEKLFCNYLKFSPAPYDNRSKYIFISEIHIGVIDKNQKWIFKDEDLFGLFEKLCNFEIKINIEL